MKTKNFSFILLFVILVILFTGCADVETIKTCITGHTYGFWGGLWHGMIAPFAFIGSLFSDDIAVWAVNNNGGWYNFGFLLGISSSVGSSSATASRRRN
jgi:hypothetical protein